MNANNFCNINASRIYTIELGGDDDRDFDEVLYDVRDCLEYEFSKLKTIKSIDPRKCYNDNRSYPQTGLVTLYISKNWRDYEATVYCTAVLRSGYYSGVNLDFEFEEVATYNLSDIEEKRVNAFIDRSKVILARVMEKAFQEYTTPLVKVAQFSNGEAVYQKA